MTEIIFSLNTDHNIVGFTCNGHSGYARRNKDDIVCAAISALTITSVNALEEIAKSEFEFESDEKSGYLLCRLTSNPNDRTETILRTMELGLKGISDSYGSKFCKVTYKED